jgi:hypothetical protein
MIYFYICILNIFHSLINFFIINHELDDIFILLIYNNMTLLLNIKKNTIEIVEENDILDKIYNFEYRPITNDDILNYKNNNNNDDNNIINLLSKKNIVKKNKKKISKIEAKIPLYDIYSNNILLIDKNDVYERVVNQYFRFPDKQLLNKLIDISNQKYNDNDIIEKRSQKKTEMMIEFLKYFDLDILYNTYIRVFYKYSTNVGKEITLCRNPSFLPQFYHIKPYFSRDEIINMGLNIGLNIKNNIEHDEIKKICGIISNNEIGHDILLNHKKYMIGEKSLGMVQYYTLQGSHIMNPYLRDKVDYKYKNIYLENLINPMWNLILNSPEFDKNYSFFRFIKNDDFLNHIKIGDNFIENGFLSATRDPFYKADTYQFGFILIKINIPKNVKGVALCLETISHFPKEKEILFPPLSKFKLIKKDSDCLYHHTDINFSSKIKTRYEFEWVLNDEIQFKRSLLPAPHKKINFLNLERKMNKPLNEKIKDFNMNHVNSLNQFIIEIMNKEIIVSVEWFNSMTAYQDFYSIQTPDGFSMYSIYDNYILFFIEIVEVNDESQMHVNYYVKYSAIDPNKIIGDDNLIKLYSSIAYYFDIHTVLIYANYMNCEVNFNNENHSSKTFGGSYCVDFYQYFTTNKKKYANIGVLNTELFPVFSYYDLDILKTISPQRILNKNDNEIFYVYNKIYLLTKHNDNIVDFYIWLKESKCYLLDIYTLLIDRILGNNNPFRKDMYQLDPISFLYNRRYIGSYSSKFKIINNIKRNIIKNIEK